MDPDISIKASLDEGKERSREDEVEWSGIEVDPVEYDLQNLVRQSLEKRVLRSKSADWTQKDDETLTACSLTRDVSLRAAPATSAKKSLHDASCGKYAESANCSGKVPRTTHHARYSDLCAVHREFRPVKLSGGAQKLNVNKL